MYFEASLHCLKGGGGRSPPALCKQNDRMIGSKTLTCFEASLHGLTKSGGVGGAQPPPICKHNALMMGFNQNFRPETFRQPCTASKKRRGGTRPLIWRFRFITYLKHAPLTWRIRFIIYLKHAPTFDESGSSYIYNTPFIWRLLFIIYLTHAPSFGNSGSSYILNTPPPLAIPAQPVS